MSTIITDSHVFFYSGREHWSNWHRTPGQIVLVPQSGTPAHSTFESSEQLFMWLKARFFGDWEVMGRIEAQPDPREVKALGRQIKGYHDASWECVRLGMMTYACYLKYSQNPGWAAELKATGDRILVEASPVDRIWGVGLDVAAAVKHAEESPFCGAAITWPGRNLLGQALMTVRGLL